MDGFSKIPGFIAPTVRERLARGAPIDSVAMLPALFLALPAALAPRRAAYAYQDQGDGPGGGARHLRRAPIRSAAFCARSAAVGTDWPATRALVGAVRRGARAACRTSIEEIGMTWTRLAGQARAAHRRRRRHRPGGHGSLPARRRALHAWSTSRREPSGGVAGAAAARTRDALHYVSADVAQRRRHRAHWWPPAQRTLRHRRRAVQQRRGVRRWRRCSIATKSHVRAPVRRQRQGHVLRDAGGAAADGRRRRRRAA